MKKRTAAMILAIMMVFSAMPNIAFAEQSVLTTRVSYSNGSAVSTETEETVDYYIVIPEAAADLAAFSGFVTFESDKLVYTGYSFEAAGVSGVVNQDFTDTDVIYVEANNYQGIGAGDFLKLTFKANDAALTDCVASIKVTVDEAADKGFNELIVTVPDSSVAVTVAKIEVTSKNILVGGDHTDGTIGFKAVKLPDLAAKDITVTASRDVLYFGEPTLEGESGTVPFTVKSGAEAGEVTVTVRAGDFSDTCTVFVDKLTVEGDLNVGSTLTARSALDGATFNFNWIVIQGAGEDTKIFNRGTGSNYTLVEEDKGGMVRLDVTAEGYEVMDYVHVGTVLGAKPAKPLLECASSTYNSITLTAVEGAEYKCGDGAWQDSPTFEGLKSGTEYEFSIRIKATADTPAGAVATAKFSTKAYEAQNVTVVVKDASGKTLPSSSYTVYEGEGETRFSGKLTGSNSALIRIVLGDEGKKFYKPACTNDSWSCDNLNLTPIISGNSHEYLAQIYLVDLTKEASITFTLDEKDPFEVRVKQGGEGGDYPFEDMQAETLHVSMPYTGSQVCSWTRGNLDSGFGNTTSDSKYFVIRSNGTGSDNATLYWMDEDGNKIYENPVNVGTYQLIAYFDGSVESKLGPLAPTVIVELTVTKTERTDVPKTPTLVSKTENSITVENRDANGNLETGVEWMLCDAWKNPITGWMKGENGQVTFTGLTDGTRYVVVARYAENDSQLASPASAALAVQTEPAPQNIGVKVKCGDKELAPADFKVYEGSEFFDGKITGAEEVTITVKLSDDAKATYKPNACSVVADGIAAEKGTCANGEYSATVSLTDYTKGGTVTFNLTEKETISVRVSKAQEHFENMQTSLTDTKTYDGKAVKWLDITYSPYTGSEEFTYFIKKDKNGLYLDTEWYDAQGKELSDDPVNVGTYKLIAKYSGNDDCKPLAETVLVTLTINPAVMETPAAPTVGEVTKDSVSYTGVKGQKYAVTTSATAPDANAADWKECTADGTMTETGLEPNTQYYLHTFVPALTSNHANSAAATTSVTTKHSYGVEVANKTTFTWNVRVGTDPKSLFNMMRQKLPVKSTGTGDIYVQCTNNSDSPFGAGITSVTLTASRPEAELSFNLNNEMISTDAPGSDSYTYIYTVKENDTNGEEIKSFEVTCVVNVVEKDVVSFTNFDDLTVTYGEAYDMETAEPQVQTGDAAYDGKLEYYYTDKAGVTGDTAPIKAGTYTVTVKVPNSNADYAGQDTATLTINKKEVELTGLAVKEKIYDGTTDAELDETNASLEGLVAADAGKVGFSTANACFNSKDVDEANAVTYTANLTGEAASNYTLKAVESISARISPRPVNITVTAADKKYDGTTDAAVTAAYAENSGMLDVDKPYITLKAENGAFRDKNVGENKEVTFTVVFASSGVVAASNYTAMYAASTTASITAKPVTVTFGGELNVDYDGQPKSATVTVNDVETGDTVNARVLYAGEATAPTLAGEYALTASNLSDPNYTFADDPYTQAASARTLKIGRGTYAPGSSSAEKSIGYLDTAEKNYGLKELFGIEIDGSFEVFLLEENDILAKHELTSGNAVVQLKEGCSIGQEANITYVFTPAAANTYNTFNVKLTVKVAAESVKSVEVIGVPETVVIGTDLDMTAIELKVTYENGSVDVFDSATYTASGYSTELKVENLGTQTLTLTASKNGVTHTGTANITVTDVLTGLSMETEPAKTEYALGATAIDLAGGKVKAIYKSGAEKSMDLTDPALTLSEVTEAMMRTLGEHAVAVSYTEGSTFQTAFTFTVVTGSVENPSDGETGGTVKDDDEFLTDPDDDTSTVPGSKVDVAIGAAKDPEAAKEAVEKENAALKDKHIALGVKLEDENGNAVHAKQPVAVQIAYPAGTDSKDTFIIYVVQPDGTLESITPAKEDKHLAFELPAGFSEADIVLAWQKYVKPSYTDDETGSFEERQRKYWKSVLNRIKSAKSGSVISASAGDYDQMPTYIMDAVKEYNVGLRIRWNGGKEILLAPANALTPEKNRIYYPLSYLEKVLAGVELGAGGSIILAPQTGDDRPVTDYNMGFFTMPGAVTESVESAANEVAPAAVTGCMNGAPILMLTASLASLAAGWFVTNRRKEEEK